VFDEDQNIVVDETIVVNVGASVVAGDIVASRYAYFDTPRAPPPSRDSSTSTPTSSG
jgi:hypothetical protein